MTLLHIFEEWKYMKFSAVYTVAIYGATRSGHVARKASTPTESRESPRPNGGRRVGRLPAGRRQLSPMSASAGRGPTRRGNGTLYTLSSFRCCCCWMKNPDGWCTNVSFCLSSSLFVIQLPFFQHQHTRNLEQSDLIINLVHDYWQNQPGKQKIIFF